MKRILFISHSMEIGGAERSLLGILNSFDYRNYKVDLFLYRHLGEFFILIPKEVNLLPINPKFACLGIPIKDLIVKGEFKIISKRLLGKLASTRYEKKNKIISSSGVGLDYSHRYTKDILPQISPNIEYDLVISFLTPHYFALEKAIGKKKVAWIHTDYSNVNIDVDSEKDFWSKYDQIIAVSESCSKSFLKKFPLLEKKIIIIENILSEEFIKKQSDFFNPSNELLKKNNELILLSVGRFSHAKNFDNVPRIAKEMINKGYKIKWYLVGYGGDESIIKKSIMDAGMEAIVIILGKKKNPYPYIKACDIYIQPSRFEGKAVTVREAQILEKPVVITHYETSSSQLIDGNDGIIVPMDNEGCAKGIINLIEDKALQKRLIENCKKSDYSNQKEIEKIYKLME